MRRFIPFKVSWLLILVMWAFLTACKKTSMPPPKPAVPSEIPPDLLLWQADHAHLAIAINGIPVRFVQGDESESGLMEISQFEKASGNRLEVLAIRADPIRMGSASIDICMHDRPSEKLATLPISVEAGEKQKQIGADFNSSGTPLWLFEEAEDVTELSAADESRIFKITSEYQNAFGSHDVEGILSLTRYAMDVQSRLSGMSPADVASADRQSLSEAFKGLSQYESQPVDQLQLIKFQKGVMVVAKDYKPYGRLSDPKDEDAAAITIRSLVFCKEHGQWVLVK